MKPIDTVKLILFCVGLLPVTSAWAMNCGTMQETIGNLGSRLSFPKTTGNSFGMNEDLLINDWTLGKQVISSDPSLAKSSFLVRAVANQAYLCCLDSVYGRYQVSEAAPAPGENYADHLDRISRRLLDIKADFVNADLKLAQKDPTALPSDQSVTSADKDFLRANLYKTQDKALTAYFSAISWVFELLNSYEQTKSLLKGKLNTTRKLITATLVLNPERQRLVLQRLKNNTDEVLTKYGEFMGEDQQQKLIDRLASIPNLEKSIDIEAFRTAANQWCEDIDGSLDRLFAEEQPLTAAGLRLRLVYLDDYLAQLSSLQTFLEQYPDAQKILESLE